LASAQAERSWSGRSQPESPRRARRQSPQAHANARPLADLSGTRTSRGNDGVRPGSQPARGTWEVRSPASHRRCDPLRLGDLRL